MSTRKNRHNATTPQPRTQRTHGQHTSRNVGASPNKLSLLSVWLALNLFNLFSEVLNYLGSLSPCVRERAENDERYLGIETNHLRLLLGVSESLAWQCFVVSSLPCCWFIDNVITSIAPFINAIYCIRSCPCHPVCSHFTHFLQLPPPLPTYSPQPRRRSG